MNIIILKWMLTDRLDDVAKPQYIIYSIYIAVSQPEM